MWWRQRRSYHVAFICISCARVVDVVFVLVLTGSASVSVQRLVGARRSEWDRSTRVPTSCSLLPRRFEVAPSRPLQVRPHPPSSFFDHVQSCGNVLVREEAAVAPSSPSTYVWIKSIRSNLSTSSILFSVWDTIDQDWSELTWVQPNRDTIVKQISNSLSYFVFQQQYEFIYSTVAMYIQVGKTVMALDQLNTVISQLSLRDKVKKLTGFDQQLKARNN